MYKEFVDEPISFVSWTAKEAFEGFKEYHNNEATSEEVIIYKLDNPVELV